VFNEKEFEALIMFKAFHTEYYDYIVELLGECKADIWFYTENPNIADIRPVDLIMIGREEKLIRFIKSAMNENMEN